MATGQMGTILRHIHKLAGPEAAQCLSDGQLLERFVNRRDEAAFASLIQRHGGMVLAVCRQLLRQEQDAEDAFQAAFLVLARKARAMAGCERLPGWLHRTAYHCAMQIRRAAARRRVHERQASAMPRPRPIDEAAWQELQTLLHEEVAALGEKHRAVFVLCCLEGKSKAEAARELGWKEGTVSGRLAQARKHLQKRLARRGATLAAVLSAKALDSSTLAAVPGGLVKSTVQAALQHAAGQALPAGFVSLEVAQAVRGVLRTLVLSRFHAPLLLLAITALGSGLGLVAYRAAVQPVTRIAAPALPVGLIEAPALASDARKPATKLEEPSEPKRMEIEEVEPRQAAVALPENEMMAGMVRHLHHIHAGLPHLAHLYDHLNQVHGLFQHQNDERATGHFGPPIVTAFALLSEGGPLTVGQKVPDFSLADLYGKKLTLRELQQDKKRTPKGIVVLSYWCSFCGSCRRVEPRLNQLAKDYQGQVAVFGLDASAGETAARVRRVLKKNGLSVPILLDRGGDSADLFGITVTTTTVVLDGDGVLRYCGQFFDDKYAYVEEAVKALLAGKEVAIKTTPHNG